MTDSALPIEFEILDSLTEVGKPGWRLPTRADLENDPQLKFRILEKADYWAILKIAERGKLDGNGYGAKIHD